MVIIIGSGFCYQSSTPEQKYLSFINNTLAKGMNPTILHPANWPLGMATNLREGNL